MAQHLTPCRGWLESGLKARLQQVSVVPQARTERLQQLLTAAPAPFYLVAVRMVSPEATAPEHPWAPGAVSATLQADIHKASSAFL